MEPMRSPMRAELDPARPLGGERTRGSYLLLISLAHRAGVRVGALGELDFEPGRYVYVGSAMGGLEGRAARHFRKAKRRRWHIDFFLDVAEPVGAALFPSERREECTLAEDVSRVTGARVIKGFGSSDCSCPGHLFFLSRANFGTVLAALDAASLSQPFFRAPSRRSGTIGAWTNSGVFIYSPPRAGEGDKSEGR